MVDTIIIPMAQAKGKNNLITDNQPSASWKGPTAQKPMAAATVTPHPRKRPVMLPSDPVFLRMVGREGESAGKGRK